MRYGSPRARPRPIGIGTSCQAPACTRIQAAGPKAKPAASTSRIAVSRRPSRSSAVSSGSESSSRSHLHERVGYLAASGAAPDRLRGRAGERVPADEREAVGQLHLFGDQLEPVQRGDHARERAAFVYRGLEL